MKKKLNKTGYRLLAVIWTLAAASMAVAFVRRFDRFNLILLALTVLSTFVASNFWKACRAAPEETSADPFSAPPIFTSNPVLFDDDPPTVNHLNKDSEENTHE